VTNFSNPVERRNAYCFDIAHQSACFDYAIQQ